MSNVRQTATPPRSETPPAAAGATSLALLRRIRGGDREALDELFARHMPALRRWARGRLAGWARTINDTSDLVQDAVMRTFRRLSAFEPTHDKALQAYLRQAVRNRISDEYRRITTRGPTLELDETLADTAPSPLEFAASAEVEERYRRALQRLTPQDRELVVARVELGYSYEQLALMTNRQRTDTARIALRRALVKLAAEMSHG